MHWILLITHGLQPYAAAAPLLLPCMQGVTVKPAHKDPVTGRVTFGAAITHLVMLSGVYADSPARAKLMYTVASWTSYFTCAFCSLIGSSVDAVVRFLGYAQPVQVDRGPDAGEQYQMGVQDAARWYKPQVIKLMAIRAQEIYEQGEGKPRAFAQQGKAVHPFRWYGGAALASNIKCSGLLCLCAAVPLAHS
jgi:hypothetical protein